MSTAPPANAIVIVDLAEFFERCHGERVFPDDT
jgi:hypothetical protein